MEEWTPAAALPFGPCASCACTCMYTVRTTLPYAGAHAFQGIELLGSTAKKAQEVKPRSQN